MRVRDTRALPALVHTDARQATQQKRLRAVVLQHVLRVAQVGLRRHAAARTPPASGLVTAPGLFRQNDDEFPRISLPARSAFVPWGSKRAAAAVHGDRDLARPVDPAGVPTATAAALDQHAVVIEADDALRRLLLRQGCTALTSLRFGAQAGPVCTRRRHGVMNAAVGVNSRTLFDLPAGLELVCRVGAGAAVVTGLTEPSRARILWCMHTMGRPSKAQD